jgi:hypothetical protein
MQQKVGRRLLLQGDDFIEEECTKPMALRIQFSHFMETQS